MRLLLGLRWLAAAVLLMGLARPAGAAMVLTLNNPNPTIVLPSSSFDYVFSGLFNVDPGYTVTGAVVSWIYQNGPGGPLQTTLVTLSPVPAANVDFFRVAIPSTAALGLYDQDSAGLSSQYSINLRNAAGDIRTLTVDFTVNLISGVPEPSAWVSASIALAAAAGLGGRRLLRRRTVA